MGRELTAGATSAADYVMTSDRRDGSEKNVAVSSSLFLGGGSTIELGPLILGVVLHSLALKPLRHCARSSLDISIRAAGERSAWKQVAA
jgi:hypothetical protein